MAASREELRLLAEAFTQGADASNDPRVRAMAREEVARVERAFRELTKKIQVVFTPDDPYTSFEEMRDRVLSERRMLVFTGFSDVPLWSPEANWKARAVHDWDHIVHSVDFSMEGEAAAARLSANRMPGLAPLYLSEITLQAATQNYTGAFIAQKLVIPDDARIERIARGLQGVRRRSAVAMVWQAAGMLKFMPPPALMVHLRAAGYSQDEAVPIAYAALMLHRRRR